MKKVINSPLLLFIPLLIIMIISFMDMQNAKLLSDLYEKNLIKQVIWYIAGFLILFIISKVNIHTILKYSKYYYWLSIILLVLVLFFGKETNGARAWFNFGILSFQPSELTKLTLILYLSNIASRSKPDFKLILKVAILTIIPSILVFLEPDTGAIIFYLLSAITILFFAPIKKYWFLILAGIILLLGGTFIILYIYNRDLLINLIGTSFFYRIERLITFQTESSYQLENALIVIGSASLFGTGLNKISLYIPEAPTDFIFAFTIGNFGIITGFLILLCYLLIDLFLINQYLKQKNKKIKLVLISFISIFFFQQIINIGMNLGLLPIIGIPLPFLSYGGTTIIIYFLFLGIILSLLKKNY